MKTPSYKTISKKQNKLMLVFATIMTLFIATPMIVHANDKALLNYENQFVTEEAVETVVPKLIAEIELDNSGNVEFLILDSGALAVTEQVKEGSVSPLSDLSLRQEATPLEVFIALAPSRKAPEILVDHHRAIAEEKGFEFEPRSLAVPYLDSASNVLYSTQGEWTPDFVANCSYNSDKTWFDNAWSGFGYNWHWRKQYSSYERNTPAIHAKVFWSHVCNNSNKNVFHNVRFGGVSFGASNIWGRFVSPGHRSIFYMWNGPSGKSYYTRTLTDCCKKLNYAVGMMGNSE